MELYEYYKEKVFWIIHFCWRQHIFDVKIKNEVTCYMSRVARRRIVLKLSQIVSLTTSYFFPSLNLIRCSKQKLLQLKNPEYQWGGCWTALSNRPLRAVDQFNFMMKLIKLHTSKKFSQNTFKIGQNLIFPNQN